MRGICMSSWFELMVFNIIQIYKMWRDIYIYMCVCAWVYTFMGFLSGLDGKESTCKAGDLGSIPGSWRSLGEGNCYPFQYSCLENPMDRETWKAAVHRVTKSRTQLSNFHFHTHTHAHTHTYIYFYISYFFPPRRTKISDTLVAASMPSTQSLVSKSFPLKSKMAP